MGKKMNVDPKLGIVPNPPDAVEPTNGGGEATAEMKKYSVGSRVVCGGEDAATIRSALQPLAQLHERLGVLREDFFAKEQQILRALGQARENYNGTVVAVGRKRGINLGPGSDQTWNFNADEVSFTRTA